MFFFLVPELKDITTLGANLNMTTVRKGRRYMAAVGRGKAITLQGDKSDVKLEIKEGCPKRAYLMEVRTDVTNFGSIIPNNECFISPIVEVLAPAETNTSSYTLRIPHCLDEDDERSKVRVRLIHKNRNPADVLVPDRTKCTDGVLFYDIDSNFIELHTPHFTTIACTYCHVDFYCLDTIKIFCFAKFITQNRNIHSRHDVEIRPYFCGIVQGLRDFREVKTIL